MCYAEISKTVDMYLFLFDDILLITRIKKAPRKVIIPIINCLFIIWHLANYHRNCVYLTCYIM